MHYTTRLLCPWDSPGKSTGMGCHALLQPRDQTSVSYVSCIGRGVLYHEHHLGSPYGHVCVCVLFQVLFLYRLLQDIEYSYLWQLYIPYGMVLYIPYSMSLLVIYFIYSIVYLLIPNSWFIPPLPFPLCFNHKFTFYVYGSNSFLISIHTPKMGFPGCSDGKESTHNAGDLGSISGLVRSPGGWHGTYSSILAWRIPRTEEPGGLQSIALQSIGHDWATKHSTPKIGKGNIWVG